MSKAVKVLTLDERIDKLMRAPYALTRYERRQLIRLLAEAKRRREGDKKEAT